MKVSGFTFIKNAVKFDFPIKEAILSIEPLCDEIIVAVGDCNDGTRELVASIHPTKIKIIDTVWDGAKNTGGIVLADETNKALAAISKETDWCVYIQGDEVLHEDGIEEIKQAMIKYKDDSRVDGLLLNYLHFYGSYDYVANSRTWYRNEIRIIKNNKNIYSYRDAQGFRKNNNEKLYVIALKATMHHYGWVKEPKTMFVKLKNTDVIWGGFNKDEVENREIAIEDWDYSNVDSLIFFKGRHPKVICERIGKKNWKFVYDISKSKLNFKNKVLKKIENLTGKRLFEYKNYKLL